MAASLSSTLSAEMLPHPPTILLDLDGTLIDSAASIKASCDAALQALGHSPPPFLDLSGLIGPPIEDVMRNLLVRYGDDRVPEAVAAYRADYGERGLFGSAPYPGIVGALESMRNAGARLFIATSKRQRFAVQIIEHLDLAGLIDAIHGSQDDGTLNQKPELIAHVIAKQGIEARCCVMVGDRKHDIFGARANSVRSLGVLWGYGTREELEAAGASDIIAQTSALAHAALAQANGSFLQC